MEAFIRDFDYSEIETVVINDLQEYEQLSSALGNNLKIFHTNIRSLEKNVDELNVFLEPFIGSSM